MGVINLFDLLGQFLLKLGYFISSWGLVLLFYSIVSRRYKKVWEPYEKHKIILFLFTFLFNVIVGLTQYLLPFNPNPFSRSSTIFVIVFIFIITIYIFIEYRKYTDKKEILPLTIEFGTAINLVLIGGFIIRLNYWAN